MTESSEEDDLDKEPDFSPKKVGLDHREGRSRPP